MTTSTSSITSRVEAGTDLILERVFHAPRALVFEAFTRAEHLRQWWGPRGWTLPVCDVDFREGGRWHYCMRCIDPDQGSFFGMESWGLAVYETIDAPNSIVYTDYFSDADQNINAEMPATRSTLTFEDVAGGTRVVTRASYASEAALNTVLEMGMLQGISETWDRLAEYLTAPQA
ncbi:SRPBCC domain-containing protein [Deinococcus sonorensis]|uniref:SRPBCC domain-containing protein n=2 Tax=Deinococcus sonorensis TaxID=309891 RepID=A0AAU7U5N7_9DEIO